VRSPFGEVDFIIILLLANLVKTVVLDKRSLDPFGADVKKNMICFCFQ